MLDKYLVSTFIGGVWLDALRIYLREQNLVDIATTYTLAKTWEEARMDIDYAHYEDSDLYPMDKSNHDVIPKQDGYRRDLYSQLGNNPLKIEGPQSLPVMNPKPLAIKDS